MPQRIAAFVPKRLAESKRAGSARSNSIYGNSSHKKWRAAVLLRDAWKCRACGRVCGAKGEAHADHITPIARGGEQYDIANGQVLCRNCHSRKTLAEGFGPA